MAFKYSCFISYCHGQHDVLKGFIAQLKTALKAELEMLLDEEVYVDEERLRPGYLYNEELASAICQSICMVVVYIPKYGRHDYCLREFEGMELLGRQRRALLGPAGDKQDFIIPVILRGDEAVPDRIKARSHYANFARFSLGAQDIIRNPQYDQEVRKIAQVIYERYQTFQNSGVDPCSACTNFRLPAATEVATWRPPFPNR